jgi:alanine dehydrogenase
MHKAGTGGFLLIGEEEARQLVKAHELVPVMEEGLRAFSAGELVHPQRTAMFVGESRSFFGVMPAYVPGSSALGAKLVTFFESNRERTLPTHFGVVVLLDPETGALRALLDGAYITEARTAAVSMLAVRHLAGAPVRRVALFGAGVQARGHAQVLATVDTIEELAVWSIDDLESFVEQTSRDASYRIRKADSAEDAARGADLLVLVTSSAEPVLDRSWISPGALIVAVGACRPEHREIDPELLSSARLFVDSREAAFAESGDVILGVEEGRFGRDHIVGELGEVIAGGVAPRKTGNEIIVFKSLGLAVEDVLAAEMVFKRAVRQGIGQAISFSARPVTPEVAQPPTGSGVASGIHTR